MSEALALIACTLVAAVTVTAILYFAIREQDRREASEDDGWLG